MTVSSSTDGCHVLVLLEVGEAIAYRDAIQRMNDAGRLAELGKALTTLLPTQLEEVRKRKRRKS